MGITRSKGMRLKMESSDGSIVYWTCWRETGLTWIRTGRKPAIVDFWRLKDHDGYVRNLDHNWINSVPMIQQLADNYGFKTTVS